MVNKVDSREEDNNKMLEKVPHSSLEIWALTLSKTPWEAPSKIAVILRMSELQRIKMDTQEVSDTLNFMTKMPSKRDFLR